MCLEDLEVTLCPLFSLALLLFWRFDVLKEAVPDSSDRNKWYRARVFTSSNGEEYNNKMQYESVKKLHKEHGVGAMLSTLLEFRRRRRMRETGEHVNNVCSNCGRVRVSCCQSQSFASKFKFFDGIPDLPHTVDCNR